jgi:hypothetical protein
MENAPLPAIVDAVQTGNCLKILAGVGFFAGASLMEWSAKRPRRLRQQNALSRHVAAGAVCPSHR